MQFFNHFRRKILKIALASFACGLLLLGATAPAMAFGSNSSNSSQGTAQMNDLQETSNQAVKDEPRGIQDVQAKAKRGPNEVQGNADLDKLNTPANSQSATTIEDQAKNLLDKITPGQ
jgi:hypothetical protein